MEIKGHSHTKMNCFLLLRSIAIGNHDVICSNSDLHGQTWYSQIIVSSFQEEAVTVPRHLFLYTYQWKKNEPHWPILLYSSSSQLHTGSLSSLIHTVIRTWNNFKEISWEENNHGFSSPSASPKGLPFPEWDELLSWVDQLRFEYTFCHEIQMM